uniref:Uncharacterized protein n=1 Tax=Kalanchoe fedtschenkoi TaxID=63787 RepID=A0A7N0TFX0_KALFE
MVEVILLLWRPLCLPRFSVDLLSCLPTPVCFGAGHVISGVSDKRKCRPRGVLVVGENCSGIDGLPNYDNLHGNWDADSGHMVVPPLPAEASMHWLLSPYDEENEQSGEGELHTSIHLSFPLSCSSGYATSSNVSKDKTAEIRSGATALTKPGMRISSLVSPSGSLVFQSLLGYSLDEEFIS